MKGDAYSGAGRLGQGASPAPPPHSVEGPAPLQACDNPHVLASGGRKSRVGLGAGCVGGSRLGEPPASGVAGHPGSPLACGSAAQTLSCLGDLCSPRGPVGLRQSAQLPWDAILTHRVWNSMAPHAAMSEVLGWRLSLLWGPLRGPLLVAGLWGVGLLGQVSWSPGRPVGCVRGSWGRLPPPRGSARENGAAGLFAHLVCPPGARTPRACPAGRWALPLHALSWPQGGSLLLRNLPCSTLRNAFPRDSCFFRANCLRTEISVMSDSIQATHSGEGSITGNSRSTHEKNQGRCRRLAPSLARLKPSCV